MYNILIILLYQPFISDEHLHFENMSAAREAFSMCLNAAFELN